MTLLISHVIFLFIEKKFDVLAEFVAVDFTEGQYVYDVIREKLRGKNVGVLGQYNSLVRSINYGNNFQYKNKRKCLVLFEY